MIILWDAWYPCYTACVAFSGYHGNCRNAFMHFYLKLVDIVLWYTQLKTFFCSGQFKVLIYFLYSQIYLCLQCLNKFLHSNFILGRTNKL